MLPVEVIFVTVRVVNCAVEPVTIEPVIVVNRAVEPVTIEPVIVVNCAVEPVIDPVTTTNLANVPLTISPNIEPVNWCVSEISSQSMLFQDGGLLALGFNVLNMGVLTAFTGYGVFQLAVRVLGSGRGSTLIAGAVGAWLSVVVGAAACAVELAVSGTTPIGLALPAMVGVHVVIGVGEAVITVGALSFIYAARKDLLDHGAAAPGKISAAVWLAGLSLALVVAGFSFAASPDPDGLEWVAAESGFLSKASGPLFSVFPDYTLPFVSDSVISGVLAVIAGTLLVFGTVFLVAGLQRRRVDA